MGTDSAAAQTTGETLRAYFRDLANDSLTPAEATANIRNATASRVVFAWLMAVLASSVAPAWIALSWSSLMTVWEVLLRPQLEGRLALPAAERSKAAGFAWLAAIHFVGGSAYTLFPAYAWSTGHAIGMVLATAWISGSANHLMVYFFGNRLLLAACMTPVVLCALIAPLTTAGSGLGAAAAAVALAALVAAACLFGVDRQALLQQISQQAMARQTAEVENVAKSRFLETLSHELRTPLNSVIGYAELIEEENEASAEDARKISASARQLLSVVDVILDLSKLESGAVELQLERVDASTVLDHLRAAAPPLVAANNNRLVIPKPTGLGEAELDLLRVHQCLMHLIAMASQLSRDSGAIEVTASRSADKRTLVFDIDTSTARKADASGEADALGLTLVRRLARRMGGDVRAIHGATLTFSFQVDAGLRR